VVWQFNNISKTCRCPWHFIGIKKVSLIRRLPLRRSYPPNILRICFVANSSHISVANSSQNDRCTFVLDSNQCYETDTKICNQYKTKKFLLRIRLKMTVVLSYWIRISVTNQIPKYATNIRRKYFFNIFKRKHGYSFMSISDSSSVLRTKSRAVPPFITFFALFWLRRRFQAIAFQLINLHIQELQETLS
jgi:hypothetical protein